MKQQHRDTGEAEMGFLSKWFNALRGGHQQSDSNDALRLFDEEISQWEDEIQHAKGELSKLIGERIGLERDISALSASISDKESRALTALRTGAEGEAMALAGMLAHHGPTLESLTRRLQQRQSRELRLKQGLLSALQQAQEYRRELRLTREQNAPSAQRDSHSAGLENAPLQDLQASLARIRRQRRDTAKRMASLAGIEAETATTDDEDPIRATPNLGTDVVLARLRQRLANAGGEPGESS